MQSFASVLIIFFLYHCQRVSGLSGNIDIVDFTKKAINVPEQLVIDKQVWWTKRVTKFEAPDKYLSEEDEKFCSSWTFHEHCGPIRIKWSVANKKPFMMMWAFNKKDKNIYYFQSQVQETKDKKAIFKLKIGKMGKVAGADNIPKNVIITERAKTFLEEPFALLYGGPFEEFQIFANKKNVWIQIPDYVVKQKRVATLYRNEINPALINLNLKIPEEIFTDVEEKFEFKVDYLQFEGHNCKVRALEANGPLINARTHIFWTDRVSRFNPSLATPKEALSEQDKQFCGTNTFFDKCGPIRTSWEVNADGETKGKVWAYYEEHTGKGKIYYYESVIEKIDENFAIFRNKLQPVGKIIDTGDNPREIKITEQALEMQEEPFVVSYIDPNNDFQILASCDGQSVWVQVREEIVQGVGAEKLEEDIMEQLKGLHYKQKFEDLREAFPITINYEKC